MKIILALSIHGFIVNKFDREISGVIHFALKQFDTDRKTILSGVVTDGGGDGTVTAELGNFIVLTGRLQSVEDLIATCTIHEFQLGLSNLCKTFLMTGVLKKKILYNYCLMYITCKPV